MSLRSWFLSRKVRSRVRQEGMPEDVYHVVQSFDLVSKTVQQEWSVEYDMFPRRDVPIELPTEDDYTVQQAFVYSHVVQDVYNALQGYYPQEQDMGERIGFFYRDILRRNMSEETPDPGFREHQTTLDIQRFFMSPYASFRDAHEAYPLSKVLTNKKFFGNPVQESPFADLLDNAAITVLVWLSDHGVLCDTLATLKRRLRRLHQFNMNIAYMRYNMREDIMLEAQAHIKRNSIQYILFKTFHTAIQHTQVDDTLPWEWQNPMVLESFQKYLAEDSDDQAVYEDVVAAMVRKLGPVYFDVVLQPHDRRRPRLYRAQHILKDGFRI